MRKIIYFALLLGLMWLLKLSYDQMQLSQSVPQLQQQLQQTEQRYALLNDQLVGLQRQIQQGKSAEPLESSLFTPIVLTGIAPVVFIKQQLELVQFALKQQQFIYALDQLNQLQQQLPQYALAPALYDGLIQAIEQDKQAIQQFVLQQTQQQQQLDQLLKRFDQSLEQELQQPHVRMNKSEEPLWWQHWFQLEKVQRMTPDLLQRQLLLKEAQLRLLIATQALQKGQVPEYRQSVQEVMQLLATLPDRNSQQLKQKLEKILNQPMAVAPKLTTLALLGS